MSFLERFSIKSTDQAQSIYSDVKFIIFAFGLISSLGFLTVYSFLYGYYFGGMEIGISNFSIISNLIPFSLQTLSITSIFFICIYYTISSLFSLFKMEENKKLLILVFSGSFIVLNICITIFFADDITFTTILSFSLIWVFIGFLVWYLYLSVTIQENISMIKGLFFTVFFLVMLHIFLNDLYLKKFQEIIIVLIIPLMLSFTTIFHTFYKLKWIAFISYFPFFFFSISIPFYIVDNYIFEISKFLIINYLLLLVAPLIINGLYFKGLHKKEIAYINKEKEQEKASKIKGKKPLNSKDTNKGTIEEQNINSNNGGLLYKTIVIFYKMFTSKKHIGYKVFSCVVLLAVFVWTPRVAVFSGGLIRILNIPYDNQIDITYINQNGVEDIIRGNYYIEHNSILYISNSDWQLETLKPLNYHVKTIEIENSTSQK